MTKQQNALLNFWNRHARSVRQSTTLIFATTVGNIIANFVALSVTLIDFKELIFPNTDTSNYKAGWILVKIKGWSVTSYNPKEKIDGLGSFFFQPLRGTSQLTPMIYTDLKIDESTLISGFSKEDDVSVLTNEDYNGSVKGLAKPIDKRNSQTLQASLIQAYSSQEPICLFVYGIRKNDPSQFLNILQVKNIRKEYINKYNALSNKNNIPSDYPSQLVNLTNQACEQPTFYRRQ